MTTITTSSIAQKFTLITICLFSSIISALAHTSPAIPQPTGGVVYSSISATVNEKSISLNWVTASEVQNNYFEVERSFDNNHFKTVALVLDGFSAEGSGKKYAFKETMAKNKTVAYYRLKQFDARGNVTYSDVMKVNANQ